MFLLTFLKQFYVITSAETSEVPHFYKMAFKIL